jgi:hypothetical protein
MHQTDIEMANIAVRIYRQELNGRRVSFNNLLSDLAHTQWSIKTL